MGAPCHVGHLLSVIMPSIFRVVISHAPLARAGEAACFWEAGAVEVNGAWKTASLAESIPGDPEALNISCLNCS